MTPRKLSIEEEAVIDALIFQWVNTEGDILEYDYKKLQKRLNETNNSVNCRISLDKQRKIVDNLSKDGILDTDWIVDAEWYNKYHSALDSNYTPIKTKPRYFWAKQTSWAYETFQLNGLISIDDAYKKHGGRLYIRMTEDDIKNIDYNYRASHTVDSKLLKDKNLKPCFYVVIDEEEPILISELREGKKPLKILVMAFKKRGTKIHRSDLINAGILYEEDRNKSLKSDIFKDNRNISNAAPFLLEIDSDYIKIRNPYKATLSELNQLKNKLKIV